jgi:type IV pilus assembly protein PilV
MPSLAFYRKQSGSMLLEALIAILIFSLGVLGLVGVQANAIRLSTDAKYRTEAVFLANELIGRLAVVDPATAATFVHRPNVGTVCAPQGGNSANAVVLDWLGAVNKTLPNAGMDKQQIIVGMDNVVTVNVCWQINNGAEHVHSVTTQMQWQ